MNEPHFVDREREQFTRFAKFGTSGKSPISLLNGGDFEMHRPRASAIALAIIIFGSSASMRGDEHDVSQDLPTLRLVLFTPKDVDAPAGAQRRITDIANYAENFFNEWLVRWGYEPNKKKIVRRLPDGSAELLVVQGGQTPASGRYSMQGLHDEAIGIAFQKYNVPRSRHVWWIFVYLGDPPLRYETYYGAGDSQAGGWAVVNYSTTPGGIRLGEEMSAGFNREFTLKGCIHELGHAFGLPHVGPRSNHSLGNSLMGPTNDVYARQIGLADTRVYLPQACAAMLWKHPIFSGTVTDRDFMPAVDLQNYRAEFDKAKKEISVIGRLKSNYPAHSVVMVNDADGGGGPYWAPGYTSRLSDKGEFRINVDEPVSTGGAFKVLFCFDNGVVTGDGRLHGDQSAIRKPYRYVDGEYRFEDRPTPPLQ